MMERGVHDLVTTVLKSVRMVRGVKKCLNCVTSFMDDP